MLSGDTRRRSFDCTTKPKAVSQHQKQTELLGSHWGATFLDSEPLRLGFALCELWALQRHRGAARSALLSH